jgi:hypothetical protein
MSQVLIILFIITKPIYLYELGRSQDENEWIAIVVSSEGMIVRVGKGVTTAAECNWIKMWFTTHPPNTIPPRVAENPPWRHAGSDSTSTKSTTAERRRKSRNRDIDPI